MATNHTENYNLNLWEPTDKFVREEFNENTNKIDEALAGKLGHAYTIFTLRSGDGTIDGGYATDPLRLDEHDMAAMAVDFPQSAVDSSKNITMEIYNGNCTVTFPMQSFILLFFPHYDLSTPFRCLLLCGTPRYLCFDKSYQEITRIGIDSGRSVPKPTIRYLGWK